MRDASPDGMTLRGVVHAQVVADLADDHIARVEPDARREVHTVLALDLPRVLRQPLAQLEGRIAGALRMILV